MLNRVKRKIKYLIHGEVSQMEFGVPNPTESDIYLVSYPKSGNTWLRYLMAYATWPELTEVDLVEMAAYIPSFRLEHDCEMMLDENAQCNQLKHRLIKHHTAYNKAAKKHIKNAICIVRDGRDVMASYWYFCNQRDQTDMTFSDFIEKTSQPDHPFGTWTKHVTGWMGAELDSKLIIRYEDMLVDTASCLKKALDFSEIVVSSEAISNAVERASFDAMKKLEKEKGFNLEQLRTVDFVRQGTSGSWQKVFGPGDLERFNRFQGGPVRELGYIW